MSDDGSEYGRRPAWLRWALLLGAWTLPGLLLASQLYFIYEMEGRTLSSVATGGVGRPELVLLGIHHAVDLPARATAADCAARPVAQPGGPHRCGADRLRAARGVSRRADQADRARAVARIPDDRTVPDDPDPAPAHQRHHLRRDPGDRLRPGLLPQVSRARAADVEAGTRSSPRRSCRR